MSIPEKIEKHMVANLGGSLQFIILNFRIGGDSAHCSLRRAPSVEEAIVAFDSYGREFHPPTAVLRKPEPDASIRDHGGVVRNAPICPDETLNDVGDEAFLWRGYGTNQRGVIKFRSGRVIGEVDAASVDVATTLARRLIDLP